MSISSIISSMFSIRSKKQEQAPQIETKIIPFNTSGKQSKRSYDYNAPVTKYGDVPLSIIQQLDSERIKYAVISYGAWVSIAKAFSAYQKTLGRYVKEQDIQAFGHSLDEFHAWNSSLNTPMDEDQVEQVVSRLTSPVIAKENAETDAIRARALGCTVQEVRDRRNERAQKEQARRQEAVAGFLAELWSGNSIAEDPTLPGAKVLAKAEATLEWMAAQDWIDAGDILLGTEDCRKLSQYKSDEYGGYEGSRGIDEQLADEQMMAAGGNSGK